MQSRQSPLTLISPVKAGQAQQLDGVLKKIDLEISHGIVQPFEALETIHYARWFLLHPGDIAYDYGKDPGVRMVFSSDFDGDPAGHVASLAGQCPGFLDQLYEHCEGYPDLGARTPDSRTQFLMACMVPCSAFFAGAPGRSLLRIRQESALRDHIWNFLNENKWKGKTPSEVFQVVCREISGRPEFQWVEEKTVYPKVSVAGLALLGIILGLLSPVVLLWVLAIRIFHETRDVPLGLSPSQVDPDHLEKLEEYEDRQRQNQFTQVLVMKPGPVRLITLLSMMAFARALIRFLFVNGKLMGIPTIHFARWVMIDQRKVMLFFSNFDGSWQQYLGDFIDKSGWGLTGIWSNTIKFPKTRFLFWGGAYDEEHFLAWSRFYQIPTQVWYCAYPHLSIKNIVNNSFIRERLGKKLNDRQAREFLNRF
ncbi:MAG TPA: hypothetical protein VMV20_08675 [Chitinophagaceae bacterium]|nr:hypothetical protein [Chitinophagaceae bacterium]